MGFKEVDYYIVDNKFPSCSARRWGGQRWIVGWSDPPEMAVPEVVVQVVSDEVSHWILEEPFTDERRSELAERLRGDLEKRGSKFQAICSDPQRLLQGVNGAGMVLMEGYGHAFMGFPWMRDEVPVELPTPREMGRGDTLYAESFHFTRWFHDHWKEFLDDQTINAEDWAWQCVNENIDKFIEIAVKFLERGTIYEYQID